MKEQILIIEDEESIARVLQLELEFEGYEIGIAHTGPDGLIKYREQKWNLILLDLMLPGLNGLDLAIAKEIADGLHAKLKIESVIGVGTTIRLFIPKP